MRWPLMPLVRIGALRNFVDEVILYKGTAPGEEERMAEHAQRETVRITRPLMLVTFFVGLLWWPFDLVLYADRPGVVRVFGEWRTAILLFSAVYYFTCDRWALLRRHYALYGTVLGAGLTFVIGASLGSLGSLEQPFFGSLYFAPIMSFPFLVNLRARIVGTMTVAAAALVGFLGVHPANLAHRDVGTCVGLMLFAVAIALFGGHATYHRFRRGFLQSELLAERTRELTALSQTLTERVEARTAELRLLADHVETLREVERGAIARELHDELGQIVTGLRVELDLAERVRARGGDVRAAHQRLGELVDATLASTRSILSHLRPRILDDFGLVEALDWLASDTGRRSGLEVSFHAEPEALEVDPDAATGVFRIVQESLTNVLRHARARRVKVGIALGEGALVATVADDGVGLPPEGARRSASMGLLGMRERAKALGGTFELSSSPEGGALVTVRLPATLALVRLRESA